MSYRDRLRPEIILTSPDGNVFTARWRGNDRAQEKKVGVFNFPNVDGSIVQDLGTASATYPLTLAFEGPDNDITASQFFFALRERGVWEVIHPVHGLLRLQPLSFTSADQPVTSGNITEVETEWIEPLDLEVLPSAPQLQATVAAQILTVNEVAGDQLNDNVFQEDAAETSGFRAAVRDVVANVEQWLEQISATSAAITAEMEAIKRDIDAVLAVVPLGVIAVAGQLQELIQLPARTIQDTQTRLDAYKNFADGISFSLTPETPGTASYNRVAVQELALTAAFGAVADISSTGDLTSRLESVKVIEDNLALFSDATDALDASQTLFAEQAIDVQYFSQSQSYAVSAALNALTMQYLLRAAFDLKVEKRFTLDRRRNPVMVAIEEYGSLGDGDKNIDLFIDSNKLEGDELLIMPKGRELVVYV